MGREKGGKRRMRKETYKSPRLRKFIVETLGWIFLIGISAGIWIDEYRWKIIFTSLFAILIASLLVIVDNNEQKKFENKRK